MRKLMTTLTAALFLSVFPRFSPAAEEYRLSLNLPIPPIHSRWHNAIKPWFDELTERSGGRIVVEPYFAEAISKQSESMDSVRNGLADFAESSFGMAIGQFPFYERVFDVVDLGRSMEQTNTILHEMERSFPQIRDEVKGVKMLFTHTLPVGMLIGTQKPVTKLSDLKGMKIAVVGGATTASRLKALGASIVNIPVIDIYMSLQQGIIDGSMVDFQLLTSRRFGDILKHVTLLPLNGGQFYCCMNQDVYDSMPEDLRQVIDSVSGEYGRRVFSDFWNTLPYQSLDVWLNEMGGELHVLTDAEYAEIDRRVEPVTAEWAEITGRAGYPGEAMAARIRELVPTYARPWKDSRSMEIFTQRGGR